MRIIGGDWGGRKIHPPAKMPYTRPTTDIAKEGLFNILQSNREIEGLKTLDLFGGTGSISFELASRGAIDLTIVEKDSQMLDFIRKTAEILQLKNLKVVPSDVFKFLKNNKEQYDFIFAGPPYALETIDQIPTLIVEGNYLKKNGWFVLEHTPRNRYKDFPLFVSERNYGTTLFSIFINKAG
ncbi:MAG TPA: RsmD family RNA methyltransferase [Puia sp.]|jgi:16S rRNA (guanine966-N2)-methyltransferase|nr:RsmD family RNA methyltransferase [Puia sp.]